MSEMSGENQSQANVNGEPVATQTGLSPDDADKMRSSQATSQADRTTENSARNRETRELESSSFALGHLGFDERDEAVQEVVGSSTGSEERAFESSDESGPSASGLEVKAEELELLGVEMPSPKVEAGPLLLRDLEAIPQKMAFKIGEAADMVGVKQYVLRYWESEFDMLRPRKSKNNQRVYSRRDVETAMMIKKLLYEDRFSIEGARSALRQLKTQVKEEKGIRVMAQSQETALAKLRSLVSEIRRIRELFN